MENVALLARPSGGRETNLFSRVAFRNLIKGIDVSYVIGFVMEGIGEPHH